MNNSSYTLSQAIIEAKRCLNCRVPQCKKGCPINNDIPEWIHQLSMGNLGAAMSIINTKSNLPAVCGRVCAHERQCEGHCILGKKGEAINIGRLERFVSDFDTSMNLLREPVEQKTRGRVAVIGSGPAGLTVAGELARKGVDVEIFEMEPEPGGVLKFGIPEYRLPKKVVNQEIKKIQELGVKINCNVTVGPDITIDELERQGFDAVFIGTGTGKPNKLNFPGSDHVAVRQAIYFLRRVSLYNAGYMVIDEVPVQEGQHVLVIGGGNTAMDAARTAVRMGATVDVVYHRSINEMSALMSEYEEAVEEGVNFIWNTSLVELVPEDAETIHHVVLKQGDQLQEVKADRVVLAVGNKPASRIVSTSDGLEVDEKGYLLTREVPYGMCTRKGIFAGGDVTKRPATVVQAMQDARKVAEGILQYIDAVRLLKSIE